METILSGTISVKAALEEKKRLIRRLLVNPKKRTKEIGYLIALAKQQQVPVVFEEGAAMNEIASGNGGVLLEVEARALPLLGDERLNGLCVYVSGVEDPYNLGSIARTLYAAGATMMIVHQRDWSAALPVLMKASAGAWERLPVYAVENDEQFLSAAKKQNRPVYAAARDDGAKPLFGEHLPKDCLLAIGGAMRGLSAKVLEASGHHLYIPYGREFRNALDSVGATAVFAFSWTADHAFTLADK